MPTSNTYLFKRPNGYWYILYPIGGKRRWKSTGSTNKQEALKKLQAFQTTKQSPSQDKSLAEFITEFLAFAEATYANATCDIFRVALRNLEAITGNCALSKLDQRYVDLYKAERQKRKSPVTVNVELRSLRSTLNYAVRWKLIDVNPFARVQLVRVPEVPPQYFTKAEFRSLLSVIDQEWFREIVIFTVMTGMRRGEVANLHWNDIDLERRLIHIHSSSTFRSKWGRLRVIPLNEQLIERLKDGPPKDPGSYVFTFNGEKVREGYLTQRFTHYVRASGITKKLHFHSLRHSHATWLVQESVPIYEIQKLLGHSSIEMTQVYSHLQSEQLHATVNRLKLDLD